MREPLRHGGTKLFRPVNPCRPNSPTGSKDGVLAFDRHEQSGGLDTGSSKNGNEATSVSPRRNGSSPGTQ